MDPAFYSPSSSPKGVVLTRAQMGPVQLHWSRMNELHQRPLHPELAEQDAHVRTCRISDLDTTHTQKQQVP